MYIQYMVEYRVTAENVSGKQYFQFLQQVVQLLNITCGQILCKPYV
jgi:hypothetical protein